MNEDIRIETERLLLRPITLDDTEAIYAYSKNENVGPNAGWHFASNYTTGRCTIMSVMQWCWKRSMHTAGISPKVRWGRKSRKHSV